MALDPAIQAAIVAGIATVSGALAWAIRAIANRHLASLDKVTTGQDVILAKIIEVDGRSADRMTSAVKQISDLVTAQLNLDRRLAAIEAVARAPESSTLFGPSDPEDTLPSSGGDGRPSGPGRPSGRRVRTR